MAGDSGDDRDNGHEDRPKSNKPEEHLSFSNQEEDRSKGQQHDPDLRGALSNIKRDSSKQAGEPSASATAEDGGSGDPTPTVPPEAPAAEIAEPEAAPAEAPDHAVAGPQSARSEEPSSEGGETEDAAEWSRDELGLFLGVFGEVMITEDDAHGESVTRTEYGADHDTGFLDCARTLASGTARGTSDLLTVFERDPGDVEGLVSDVKRYGGDNQTLSTGGADCGTVVLEAVLTHLSSKRHRVGSDRERLGAHGENGEPAVQNAHGSGP